MQFLLSSHRFRRLLNSATAVTLVAHRRSHPRWPAGPQRVFAFPQDVVSQLHQRHPRDVKLPASCIAIERATAALYIMKEDYTAVAYMSHVMLLINNIK